MVRRRRERFAPAAAFRLDYEVCLDRGQCDRRAQGGSGPDAGKHAGPRARRGVAGVGISHCEDRGPQGARRPPVGVVGLVLGPLALLVLACYPARYRPETTACPQCGKPLAVRAVACHFCQYRFPSVDVMITRAPEDADSRRGLLSEIAREYGIPYADAAKLLEQLPVAGYRHVLPDQVSEYVAPRGGGGQRDGRPGVRRRPRRPLTGSPAAIPAEERPSGSRPR